MPSEESRRSPPPRGEPAPVATEAGALAGVLVVDASQGVAGGYAGRLLADLGAEVVKIEPPSGDSLRALGPFPGDRADLEAGGLHLALNAGKRSLVLDLESRAGRERFRALAMQADVVLENAGPGAMEGRGLGPDALLDAHPELVYASHAPFGLTGPYARRVTTEIVDWAMGGYMYFGGEPGRSPLMVHGHQAELHAGMQLAAGALAALWHARRSGAGQHVEVSTLEAMLNAHVWLTTMWTHEGLVQSREPSMLVPCADGQVIWMGMRNLDIFVLVERPELVDDPRWETIEGWRGAIPEIRALFAEWARDHSGGEICERGQALRLAITQADTVEELSNSRQLRERAWWRETPHPELGALLLPGPPWVLSGTPAGPRAAGASPRRRRRVRASSSRANGAPARRPGRTAARGDQGPGDHGQLVGTAHRQALRRPRGGGGEGRARAPARHPRRSPTGGRRLGDVLQPVRLLQSLQSQQARPLPRPRNRPRS